MISTFQGKPTVKKVGRVYNEAYNQISKLWHLLPESAKNDLKSDQLEEEDMEDGSFSDENRNKFVNAEGHRNSLKGQIASYKEKLAKKKLKKRLHKQLKKQINASNKKELLEKKLLKRKENNKKMEIQKKSEKEMKVMPEVSENLDVVENKPKKSKKLKVKFIDDPMEVEGDESGQVLNKDSVKENRSGLSNKKLRILKKQEMKSEKKKEKKKIMKQKREEAKAKEELMIEKEVKPQVSEQQTDEDNTIMFNKMDDTEDIHKKKFKKDKKIKGVEKDPKKALTKLLELNKRISDLKVSGQEEKAAAIESKHSWNKAILKADGIKIKDNVELLKKSIRKKEKKKGKSKEEWQKRTDFKDKKMADAQKKRKNNIMKKKNDKKQKKIKKSIKKGRVVI